MTYVARSCLRLCDHPVGVILFAVLDSRSYDLCGFLRSCLCLCDHPVGVILVAVLDSCSYGSCGRLAWP